jgi:hypothetical protein
MRRTSSSDSAHMRAAAAIGGHKIVKNAHPVPSSRMPIAKKKSLKPVMKRKLSSS